METTNELENVKTCKTPWLRNTSYLGFVTFYKLGGRKQRESARQTRYANSSTKCQDYSGCGYPTSSLGPKDTLSHGSGGPISACAGLRIPPKCFTVGLGCVLILLSGLRAGTVVLPKLDKGYQKRERGTSRRCYQTECLLVLLHCWKSSANQE